MGAACGRLRVLTLGYRLLWQTLVAGYCLRQLLRDFRYYLLWQILWQTVAAEYLQLVIDKGKTAVAHHCGRPYSR